MLSVNHLDNQSIFEILRHVVESIPDAAFAVDTDRKIIAWNRGMEMITGLRQAAMIGQDLEWNIAAIDGRPDHELIALAFDDDARNESNYHVIREENSVSRESFAPCAYGGKGAYLREKASLLRDASGHVIGAIETIRDVTSRKKAEVSLRESEETRRNLIEMLRDVVYMTDRDGKLTYLSPIFEEITGYSCDEFISRLFTDIVSHRYRERALRFFNTAVETGESVPYDIEIRAKNGRIIPVAVRGAPLFNADGAIIGRIGVARDITERKEAEKALKESEERYRMIAERMTDVIWIADMDLRTLYVTPSVETVLGFTPEERMRQTLDQQLPPDSLAYAMEILTRELALEQEGKGNPDRHVALVLEYYHKNGSTRWMEIVISGMRDEQGVLTGLYGVARDVNDRRKAEMALRESEARYRELINGMNETVWVIDFDGTLIDVNNTAIEMLGYSKEELFAIGLSGIDSTLKKDDIKALAHTMPSDRLQIFETTHTAKDGRTFPVEVSSSLVTYQGKQVILSIARDITERRKIQQALQDSEKRYRVIVENVNDIIWTVGLDLRFIYVSPSNSRVSGYMREEVMTMSLHDVIVPESLDLATRTLSEELALEASGAPFDPNRSRTMELEICHKNGGRLWFEVSATFNRDADGRPTEILAVGRDITERRRMEKALSASEELYRTIFETTGTATVIIEEDGTISLANTGFERLSGYSREEIEGKKSWMDFVHEADLTWMMEENRKRKQGDSSALRNYEYRFLNREGEGRYVFLTASIIPETERIIASLLDITERKQSEILTRSQRDLAAHLNKLTQMYDVLKTCGETAIQLSQMECGGVYLVNEEKGDMELICHQGLSPEFVEEVSSYPGNSSYAQLVKRGEPVYCRAQESMTDLIPMMLKEKLRSIAIVPIHYEGQAIACLNVASRIWDEVPDFSRIVLESITSQVGTAIARVNAEALSRKCEEMFRALAENSFDVIMRFDRQCRHLYASPRVEQETGIPAREFIGKTHSELGFPEEIVNLSEETIQKVFETGEPQRVEFMLPSGIWLDWLMFPEFDENGDVKAVMTTSRDITDRKRRELYEREEKERLERENMRLKSSARDRWRFGDIIGKSDVMQEVYELIHRAAGSDVSVIIYGESGTGKELVARAIHDMSSRKGKEFVPVNCGAIPENLMESEFFGHRKGAFTGAHIDKHGYLDLADGGSLFLDEIGDLGMNIQVKLLRALEGGGYTPLGNARVKYSDFRIIAATNRDLADDVRHGTMRGDFFYRIHIVPITLPPLRERREDIPLLVEHFLKANPSEVDIARIPSKVMDTLLSYDWPGNVRELQNVLHRYLTIRTLDFMSVPSCGLQAVSGCNEERNDEDYSDLNTALERYERDLIMRMLERKKWHRIKAAEALGISRHTLFRKMKSYELT